MSIDVRIPTILRSFTGGAKTVQGTGDTLADLLTDLDTRYPGIKGRLITEEGALTVPRTAEQLNQFVLPYIAAPGTTEPAPGTGPGSNEPPTL